MSSSYTPESEINSDSHHEATSRESQNRSASNEREPLGNLERAERDCEFLNSIGIRMGKHVCHFEVVNPSPGSYAVICKSHPGRPN